MKTIEKKKLINLLFELEKEVDRAKNEVDNAIKNVQKKNWSKEAYNCYQQKYNYLSGTMMMRTIVRSELRKLGIEVDG